MFSAHKGHRRRRGRIAVVLTALAAGAASVFLMVPANAGTNSATSTAPSTADVRAAVAHDKVKGFNDGSATASPTASPTATSGGGTASPRIIGGSDTPLSSAPWMVQLWYDTQDGFFDFCGGTLVAHNKVLTAAHCVAGKNWAAHGLVLGGTTAFGGTDTSPYSYVRAQWSHAYFNSTTIDDDVAVLTLSTPFNFATLPLATNTDTALYAPDTEATVYGWGNTQSANSDSHADTLQQLQMPLHSDADCKANLDAAVGDGGYDTAHMICAGIGGTGDDSTGKTTCSGDSGGPLVVSGRIVGIVSWGVENTDGSQICNVSGTYDVFTRVSAFGGAVQPRINDTDASRDLKADLIARTSAGSTYLYASTGTAFKARATAPTPLAGFNLALQADVDRDGYQDYLVRNATTGNVYVKFRTASSSTYRYVQIGTGWNSRRANLIPGDLTGDGIPDLLSETSDGRAWIYSGKGNGTFNSPVQIGTGWNRYNLIVGHGDFTNDGKTDVFARDARTGDLYLLQGTGKAAAPFATPLRVRSAWTGWNSLITTGDVTGDGRADLLARSTSGTLYLYKGTGQANGNIFAAGIRIGTGWNGYNLLG